MSQGSDFFFNWGGLRRSTFYSVYLEFLFIFF